MSCFPHLLFPFSIARQLLGLAGIRTPFENTSDTANDRIFEVVSLLEQIPLHLVIVILHPDIQEMCTLASWTSIKSNAGMKTFSNFLRQIQQIRIMGSQQTDLYIYRMMHTRPIALVIACESTSVRYRFAETLEQANPVGMPSVGLKSPDMLTPAALTVQWANKRLIELAKRLMLNPLG